MMMKNKRSTYLSILILLILFCVGLNVDSIAQSVGNTFSGAVYFRKAKVHMDTSTVQNVYGTLGLQSGSNLEVNSGADIEVESGGDINVQSGGTITIASGATLDLSGTISNLDNGDIANRTRYVDLPLANFLITASGIPLAAATEPGSVIANNVPAAEWAQSETAKISNTFRVPSDYVSGANFICTFTLDAASADTTVDFEVFVNVAAAAFDAAATNQTPVAIADDTTNNQAITLTVATDTFAAGNLVTFNVWRAAGTGAGSNLNLLGCYLSYTADM